MRGMGLAGGQHRGGLPAARPGGDPRPLQLYLRGPTVYLPGPTAKSDETLGRMTESLAPDLRIARKCEPAENTLRVGANVCECARIVTLGLCECLRMLANGARISHSVRKLAQVFHFDTWPAGPRPPASARPDSPESSKSRMDAAAATSLGPGKRRTRVSDANFLRRTVFGRNGATSTPRAWRRSIR